MLSEKEYWNIYAEYAQLEVVFGDKIIKWIESNPKANSEQLAKQYEFLHKIEFLKNIFLKQYHFMQSQSIDQLKVYEERKRLLDKIVSLQNENNQLKDNIL